MVTFARYTEIAYEIAKSKPWYDQLQGPGSQQTNQRFISELAQAYNRNNHSEASVQAARQFLESNVMPP